MRKKLIAGNWKMNMTSAEVSDLVAKLIPLCQSDHVDYVVCPPYVYLSKVVSLLKSTRIRVGAQNVADQVGGAYTGEVSANMLKDVGCEYAIVGHSERRSLYTESDAMVVERFFQALASALVPILCVGETLAQREAEQTMAVIDQQLDAVLLRYQPNQGPFVIAYEPVWAIGTGESATPAMAETVHAHIRKKLQEKDAVLAESVRILYGGSVKPGNALDLFMMPNIDGALIGGASLDAESFSQIAHRGE